MEYPLSQFGLLKNWNISCVLFARADFLVTSKVTDCKYIPNFPDYMVHCIKRNSLSYRYYFYI